MKSSITGAQSHQYTCSSPHLAVHLQNVKGCCLAIILGKEVFKVLESVGFQGLVVGRQEQRVEVARLEGGGCLHQGPLKFRFLHARRGEREPF